MNELDFVAIGDMTTDAFIRLKDAEVHCKVSTEECEICMPFATKIPYEFVKVVPAVGNSANAAVAAARLGLRSALVSNIGDDNNGKDCLKQLKSDKVRTDLIRVQEGKATNYHYVLWYQDERTILIKHEAFDYKLPDIPTPRWIYLSSLGEHGFPLHAEIARYLDAHPEVSLAFQPGTFQIRQGREKLQDMYRKAKVFFCNTDEARAILGTGETAPGRLSRELAALGPELVVLTAGKDGAYLYFENETFFMPPYPDSAPPYERTGAGDAFASTFVAALALGKTPLEALQWAPVNAMSVVQYVGAQEGLLDRKTLEGHLKQPPEGYKPELVV